LEQTVNQEAFEDLEQALDKTKIIDLSKAYIRKLVDSTSTIEKEDKEEAIQYISDLFVEEFNKHSFTQTLNKIDFISFTGNNFMNFGKFNFEIKPAKINRIIGTNGIGKTKIWSFIAWMLVDSITSQQNAKEKTYNYALLFNDSSEEDVVSGEAKFFVNGELHSLTKSLSEQRYEAFCS
jgi:ATPase subunit of ABC transporter with duplicated ATPase domains